MAEAHLTRRESFSSARHFRLQGIGEEEAERLYGALTTHGHDYLLDVTIRGEVDKITGMVENLYTTKDVIRREVIAGLGGVLLNDEIDYFKDKPPTLENLTRHVWDRLHRHYGDLLFRVTLAEEPALYAELESGRKNMFLTRGYYFCAAHRLHRPEFSDEENRELFGKCNNPSGHGHNYRLEVTLSGDVDERSGSLCRAGELDALVRRKVVDYLDHKNLDADIEEFRELNSTAENIARVIWRRLGDRPGGAELYRIRVFETDRNVAEYYGS